MVDAECVGEAADLEQVADQWRDAQHGQVALALFQVAPGSQECVQSGAVDVGDVRQVDSDAAVGEFCERLGEFRCTGLSISPATLTRWPALIVGTRHACSRSSRHPGVTRHRSGFRRVISPVPPQAPHVRRCRLVPRHTTQGRGVESHKEVDRRKPVSQHAPHGAGVVPFPPHTGHSRGSLVSSDLDCGCRRSS